MTADSMTPVKSSRFNFPELPLDPPDYDEPEEQSSIEYIIVDLDDDILVSKDTFEFQGTPEFESEEDAKAYFAYLKFTYIYGKEFRNNFIGLEECDINDEYCYDDEDK